MREKCHGYFHLIGFTAGLLLTILLMASCAPRIIRAPVSAEDIRRANEATLEADVAFSRKDYYAALIKYLEASRLNPNSEFIQNKLGIAYSQLKYFDEAKKAFRRAQGLNPKYAYSVNNLGSVYFAENDLKGAEKAFKRAISLMKNVASFHVNLGSVYFEREKFDKGMVEWRKALAIDPEALTRSEGISLPAAGSQSPPAERAYFKARLYASLGDAEHAVENLEQAINSGFTDIEAIRKEKDFDPIRTHDKFVAFMKTASLLAAKP